MAARRSPSDVALAAEALFRLLIARHWVRNRPIKDIVTRLEAMTPAVGAAHPASVVDIAWALGAVARRLPLRLLCYERGLAAIAMLAHRGLPATFHYGVGQGEGELAAHVWVTSGPLPVVGCAESVAFQEVVTVAR